MKNSDNKTFLVLSTALAVACMMMLTACGALQLMSDTSPSGHFQKTSDIRYGPAERNLLDLYEPIDVADDAPLVVFFYGGGWRDGKREEYAFVASALTEAGFRVVIPDYRLFPDVTFPTFMEDAAKVVSWALKQGTSDEIRNAGLYLAGHSAGAHIAALLATDERYLDAVSVPSGALFALIGLSGPYDFLPIEQGYLIDVFPASSREDSQPINFVSSTTPPTLLIHGMDDELVKPGNSQRFAAALREAGVPVTEKYYEGTGHAAVAIAMAPRLDFVATTLEDTISFINQREQNRRGSR